MKKKRNLKIPVLLLCVSALLLLASTVGSARAALTYYSENYAMEVTVSSIGVTLAENGKPVSYRNYLKDDWSDSGSGELLTDLIPAGERLIPGKTYPEALSITNSGAIDSYVRVLLYRSWQDSAGGKVTSLSPELIEFQLTEGSGWVVDEKASTPERTVLYYTKPLASQADTPALCEAVRISNDIYREVREEIVEETAEGKTIRTVYLHDGYYMSVEAEVDAVQTHNAEEAIKSAWGVDVTVEADGTLNIR
ncbi:hypothetical protein NSB25_10490 [Acetatifactor muris]|uniref:Alternate signal-mediated exported protein, CPF_0494 family n=1 Tax=Acetatifactor muris TaxID=879566 RepID=A0A2K4ZFQ2_9FIRM|nr:hypothetical protein [Acetatifactor muris]MCR2047708.1 hypothetical protein [Acetatifactor muris]SOY29284.1 hypothetical protein AMURIS_01999 [Acetatifactor muris]